MRTEWTAFRAYICWRALSTGHFIRVSPFRFHALAHRRGFGSVRVECAIGDVTWRTSVFPQTSGGYFLPVKKDVCRRAGVAAGDEVTVMLELL